VSVEVTVDGITYVVPPEWMTLEESLAEARAVRGELLPLVVKARIDQDFTIVGTDRHAVVVRLNGVVYTVLSDQWKSVGSFYLRVAGKYIRLKYLGNGKFDGIPDGVDFARTHDSNIIVMYRKVCKGKKVEFYGIPMGCPFSNRLLETLMDSDFTTLQVIRAYLNVRKDVPSKSIVHYGNFIVPYVMCDVLGVPFTREEMLLLENNRKPGVVQFELCNEEKVRKTCLDELACIKGRGDEARARNALGSSGTTCTSTSTCTCTCTCT
jgi:hypothetical protein